jgi:hypothetical protein
MRDGLEVWYPREVELDDLATLVDRLPNWGGSLEDALVAVLGLQLDSPVWTFNYRDLAAFPNLRFWNPA